MKISKIFSRLILPLAAIIFLGAGAFAAADSSAAKQQISISPFLQNVNINSDQSSKSFYVELSNDSGVSQKIHVTALNFGTLDESGGVVFAGSNATGLLQKYGLAKWLHLDTSDIILLPHHSTKIKVTIENDTNLAPGGHYGAIVATVRASDKSGENGVSVNQQLSSLVFAAKLGGEVYNLHLDSVKHNATTFHLPSRVTLRFYNPGNIHVTPRGLVKLTTGNRLISQGIINDSSSYVLPQTYRQIPVDLKKVSSNPPRLFGNYKLEIDYRYDGFDKSASKSISLKWINLAGIIITVIFIGVIIAGGKYLLHRRK